MKRHAEYSAGAAMEFWNIHDVRDDLVAWIMGIICLHWDSKSPFWLIIRLSCHKYAQALFSNLTLFHLLNIPSTDTIYCIQKRGKHLRFHRVSYYFLNYELSHRDFNRGTLELLNFPSFFAFFPVQERIWDRKGMEKQIFSYFEIVGEILQVFQRGKHPSGSPIDLSVNRKAPTSRMTIKSKGENIMTLTRRPFPFLVLDGDSAAVCNNNLLSVHFCRGVNDSPEHQTKMLHRAATPQYILQVTPHWGIFHFCI